MTGMETRKTLVLYSGGKDSFLTACTILTEQWRSVVLLSFNNGALVGESNLQHGVQRLKDRFGDERVSFAGVYGTAAVVQRLSSWWVNTSVAEIARKYPAISPCQIRCLNCQTAMWVSAMAFALAKDIRIIVAGYRDTDIFCTGMHEYVEELTNLATTHGLVLEFNQWDIKYDIDPDAYRDMRMMSYGFEPRVLEPMCTVGTPVVLLSKDERRDLTAYFRNELLPIMEAYLPYYTGIFRNIILSKHAYLNYAREPGEHFIVRES